MFNNKRMITRRISSEVPLILQLAMWSMIDSMQVPKDYLQIFSLSVEDGKQRIIHEQGQPEYRKEYLLDTPFLCAKIYVIDDKTHSTMLFSDEY